MQSHALKKGFTMIEVLVVLGIATLVTGLSVFIGMDTLRGSAFRSDRDLLVALLQHARAESMSNICNGTCANTDGRPHGVKIDTANHTYIVFQGASYSARDVAVDQVFEGSPTVTYGGSATEVVFSQLTGSVPGLTTFSLTGEGKASTITIEQSGRIHWTN